MPPIGGLIIISIVVGFIIALIVNLIMRSQLKSVAPNNRAADYVVPDSLKLSVSREMFLYKDLQVTPRPKENNNNK